jgi:hypothetical protein
MFRLHNRRLLGELAVPASGRHRNRIWKSTGAAGSISDRGAPAEPLPPKPPAEVSVRDGLIRRCFIYLDPDYAAKDTARYSWLE